MTDGQLLLLFLGFMAVLIASAVFAVWVQVHDDDERWRDL